MDLYLALKMENYVQTKANASLMLPMLIQGKIGVIKQLVAQYNGVFKYSYGNIAAIIIPVNALSAFNDNVAVTRMEGAPPRNRPMDDSSNVKNHITEVLAGQAPLPKAYNGKGVVIGFIDTGIELKHSDFRDSSGTRVKYLWDMNIPNGPYTPMPWNYGQAWNKSQMDILSTLPLDIPDTSHCVDFGHGSNVAGAAVGNGTCNGHEIGGCPKSDIIMVAYNFDTQTATMFTDAVQYIFKCADSLNEPCVINASMGSYDGSHDDSDLQGEMIDTMIAAKQPGRVFVTSAGNGGTPYHVHDTLNKGDTAFTWFLYDAGIGVADIPIFANENNFKNLKFKIRCDKVQSGSFLERDTFTVWSSIKDFMGLQVRSIYNKNGQRLGVMNSIEMVYGKGSYSVEFQIAPDSTGYYWGFEATDTSSGTFGRCDIWDLGSINGVVNINALAINPVTYPEIKKYKQPDTLMTICSSYQCSPNVITVQTYFNRLGYTDCLGNPEKNGNLSDVPGGFNYGTSRGPTRNFTLMKPEISASGNFTLSAVPLCFSTQCNGNVDALGCHNTDGGTSMASPMVASAVGLYLQMHPLATDTNVRRCLIETAYNDFFTGPKSGLPNTNWGWGKLHTFDMLTQCGPTDVPNLVNPKGAFKLSAYPNPYTSNTTIAYDFSTIKEYSNASIVVYNLMGKTVKTISLLGNSGAVSLDRTNLASGVYFYSLVVDGARLRTEKLEVL